MTAFTCFGSLESARSSIYVWSHSSTDRTNQNRLKCQFHKRRDSINNRNLWNSYAIFLATLKLEFHKFGNTKKSMRSENRKIQIFPNLWNSEFQLFWLAKIVIFCGPARSAGFANFWMPHRPTPGFWQI
jgi:hypothetical protein